MARQRRDAGRTRAAAIEGTADVPAVTRRRIPELHALPPVANVHASARVVESLCWTFASP